MFEMLRAQVGICPQARAAKKLMKLAHAYKRAKGLHYNRAVIGE
jgi:hypothetical protein